MKILVFSNWSIDEGLTRATLFPLIEAIMKNEQVGRVIFCTVESKGVCARVSRDKLDHIPFMIGRCVRNNRILNLLHVAVKLRRVVKEKGVDLIWCKGASAGGLGSLVHMLTDVPLVVDSFEPHSEYMVQSRTWSWWSPKFLLQRLLEELTVKKARALLPVSRRYAELLRARGIQNNRIFTIPCIVDPEKFALRPEIRQAIRKRLIIADDCTVGIYVGKYGGLYYDQEAFHLYAELFRFFGDKFFLIVITEMDAGLIKNNMSKYELPLHRTFISKIDHSEIVNFLSAADFGISTIKSVPVMEYCSPIKHGEYWAANLPILTTLGFGDDAEIIRREKGGVVVDIMQPDIAPKITELQLLMEQQDEGRYARLARTYRHPSIMQKGIQFVLEKRLPYISKPNN